MDSALKTKTYINGIAKNALMLLLVLSLLLFAACGGDESTSDAPSESGENSAGNASESSQADILAPIIKGDNIEIFQGDEIVYTDFVTVTDNADPSPRLTVDDSKADTLVAGVYPIVYTATDASGNVSKLSVNLTVKVKDITAPVVTGKNFRISVGDSVSYKKQITVTDDFDENPTIEIDNSKVNINAPGVYPVVYTVTDASGNATVFELSVIVIEQISDPAATEAYVLSEAAKILETIISEDDSDLQKLYSIYRWTKRNIGYTGKSDKSDWVKGAYDGFVTRGGDCYTYFAVAKALVTVAGFENHDVIKLRPNESVSRHYWSIINLNGEYYHYDCTPYKFDGDNFCMVTDEELFTWDDTYYKGAHTYDSTGLPTVSTNSIQDRINYSSGKLKY